MKKTRLIALILCVAMLVTLFTGCTKKTVMKINGEAIPEGIYTYFYASLNASYGSYYDEATIKEFALSQVKQLVALEDLADQLGIEFTAAENKAIIDTRKANINETGRESYIAMLQAMSLTEKQYEDLDKTYYLYSKLYNYYYGETGTEVPSTEDMRQDYLDKYVHATHILIGTTEEGDDPEAKREIAEEALAKAQAGEDFIELIKEYGEDPGVAETPEVGYYFAEGEMVTEFWDASVALEVDEISGIVESDFGYHIIKRLPITDEYVDALVTAEGYYDEYCSDLLYDKLTALMDTYTVEYTEAFDKLNFTQATAYFMNSSN